MSNDKDWRAMRFAIVLACIFVLGVMAAPGMQAELMQDTTTVSTTTVEEPPPDPAPVCGKAEVKKLRHGVRYWRAATWRWQDLQLAPRSRLMSRPDARYIKNCDILNGMRLYWKSQRDKWKARYPAFKRTFTYRLMIADKDWHDALSVASRIFGVSYSWLHDCSHSEGGHGRWVPNTQGSGAGGWMQFMSGTLYGNIDTAFAQARARGFFVHSKFRSWYSRVGQAITAAWMFHNEGSGQWTGENC